LVANDANYKNITQIFSADFGEDISPSAVPIGKAMWIMAA